MVDSEPKTAERVCECLKNKKNITYHYNAKVSAERNYALKNICGVMRFLSAVAHDHDVVSVVDLDDRITPGALYRIHQEYANDNNLALTYGSYRPLSGKKMRNCGKYPDNCNFRSHRWLGSHLLTFRYGLLKYLVENHAGSMMLAGGKWPKYAYDFAITFSLMELAGQDRIKHIPDILYIYNDTSPHCCHKIARKAQIAEANWFRAQEPLNRLENIIW